jgi:hypothetical protein
MKLNAIKILGLLFLFMLAAEKCLASQNTVKSQRPRRHRSEDDEEVTEEVVTTTTTRYVYEDEGDEEGDSSSSSSSWSSKKKKKMKEEEERKRKKKEQEEKERRRRELEEEIKITRRKKQQQEEEENNRKKKQQEEEEENNRKKKQQEEEEENGRKRKQQEEENSRKKKQQEEEEENSRKKKQQEEERKRRRRIEEEEEITIKRKKKQQEEEEERKRKSKEDSGDSGDSEEKDLTKRIRRLEIRINRLIEIYLKRRRGKRGSDDDSDSSSGGFSSRDLNYMYKEAKIYQNIFEAFDDNTIQKVGDPVGWDENSYIKNKWEGRNILNIGNADQVDRNSLEITIPEGEYDVLWLRVLNERWETFNIRPSNVPLRAHGVEIYACGWRNLNEISPDGTSPDSWHRKHMWCPIPIRKHKGKLPGKVRVWTGPNTNSGGWISGIGFGKNLWNHAKNSAVAYHWGLNGGSKDVGWDTHEWNSDNLAKLQGGKKYVLRVPVIPNGKDKLVYIIEHNNNWLGIQHGEVRVNTKPIERFRTSYSNPFATHINSKIYSRYMAAKIPSDLIPADAKFIDLEMDFANNDNWFYFREIGTHDYI